MVKDGNVISTVISIVQASVLFGVKFGEIKHAEELYKY